MNETKDKTKRLNIVLCWHMHQPDYRDRRSGQFQLPWTYLHSIKDYVDMAAHLENTPQARTVVNFSPILLEQIDDYANQIQQYFELNKAIKDPVLQALVDPVFPTDYEARLSLTKACMRAHETQMIERFEPYKRLVDISRWLYSHPAKIDYMNNQFLADLLVWFHLAWLGETVRRNDRRVQELIDKGHGFSLQDRHQLLEIIGELIASLFGRYKALSDIGQVELSLSPYAHPIVPLLMNINSTKQAMPDASLPVVEHYPGGVQRSDWHIKQGLAVFERYFNCKPSGCWLSEGGVSSEALTLLDQYDFTWTATGTNVLVNSLAQHNNSDIGHKENFLYRSYTVGESKVRCFFRDDELSDLIGFTYSDWHADDAVANFIAQLETLANNPEVDAGSVVSIILDGENAWEHYAENGYYFLSALYNELVAHPQLQMCTFSEALEEKHTTKHLDTLCAGSWVYGSFSTWIGDQQKNRAWDMLADAKHCYDRVMAKGTLSPATCELAARQLAICEASDWFWWFGDYNPQDAVSDFERLFRMHLSNLYQLLDEESPSYLTEVFTRGGGNPLHGGTMRQGQQ